MEMIEMADIIFAILVILNSVAMFESDKRSVQGMAFGAFVLALIGFINSI